MSLKLSLPAKIVVMLICGLVVLAALTLTASRYALYADGREAATQRQQVNMDVAWEVLGRYGTNFRLADGALFNGTTRLNGLDAAVDRITEIVGGTATIFMGDTRVATNVRAPDGARAVGTQLARGAVHDAVLRDGQSYRGEAVILGVPYFTAYDPIQTSAGETIGILYVGIPQSEFFAQTTA